MEKRRLETYTLPGITMEQVFSFRNILSEGDIVNAELWIEGDKWGTQPVEIFKKYTHIAMTDKGPVSWINIAIHNKGLLVKYA